jgi:hypothetical protein
MIDVLGGHEGVQQCLNALAWTTYLEGGAIQVTGHLLIGHARAVKQWQGFFEFQSGEPAFTDAGDVGAASFDPEHRDLAAHVIGLEAFRAGVATENIDQCAVTPKQP